MENTLENFSLFEQAFLKPRHQCTAVYRGPLGSDFLLLSPSALQRICETLSLPPFTAGLYSVLDLRLCFRFLQKQSFEGYLSCSDSVRTFTSHLNVLFLYCLICKTKTVMPFYLFSFHIFIEIQLTYSVSSRCVCQSLSYLPLCDPMDCSLPDSSVHGILQARILEWAAIPCSKLQVCNTVIPSQPIYLIQLF